MSPKPHAFALAAVLAAACWLAPAAPAAEKPAQEPEPAPVSADSQACLDCHAIATPGIVADWKRSRMSRVSPAQALARPELSRRFSAAEDQVPPELMNQAVGCAECHMLRPEKHPGSFDHEGFSVHTVVSPADCATCHPTEREQYGHNLMSHAWVNLTGNPLYMQFEKQVNGVMSVGRGGLAVAEPTPRTRDESCLACHGTEVKVEGRVTKTSAAFGEVTVPKLSGWPNRGVGRKNPDGSLGSCTACHSRHQFAIQMARQPYTCGECHKGPDVLTYRVYMTSKHGGAFASLNKEWDFQPVPWTLGKDFSAPTCAVCHLSLVTTAQGEVVARRTHRMNDRMWQRLLGLIYSAPHPIKADTTGIRNADGQPLPTTLAGEPASEHLIGEKEQAERRGRMRGVCLGCHSAQWVDGQLANLDEAVRTSNANTLAATKLMQQGWQRGLADPANLFDEYWENVWMQGWFFYANSVRFSAAMMGTDYGVFDNGRWETHKTVRRLHHWLQSTPPAAGR
jgi:hypothetical protein